MKSIELGIHTFRVWEDGLIKRDSYITRHGRRRKSVFPANVSCSNGYERINYTDKDGKPKEIGVHRLMAHCFLGLDLTSDKVVDHIDGDRSNNHIDNLQICTKGDNSRLYRRKSENTTSKYLGVYWNKHAKQWAAQIYYNHERIFIGYFKNEDSAARAVNKQYLLHGFTHTNEVNI